MAVFRVQKTQRPQPQHPFLAGQIFYRIAHSNLLMESVCRFRSGLGKQHIEQIINGAALLTERHLNIGNGCRLHKASQWRIYSATYY